ncbi:MAG: ATP-binding protein [Planctomycetes bacterium]|nr:ATP-binding protein [Planctomycetota bacterium]
MGVLSACNPRKDVLKGDLDDAIFAADFGDLVRGEAPPVYREAKTFFQNTHPAKQLCKVTEAVFGRLANPKEGGATIRLSTGFGGGKTHTLMALWHLAHHIDDPAMGTDLLPAAGRPKKVAVAALDASKAGVPVFARHGKTTVHSLWGELAHGLGEEKALKVLGEADDPERQPDEALLEKLFPTGPVLLLLDEIVVYLATLSERGQGNLMAFLNKLAAVVGKRPQTVLVVTDPADQRAYSKEAAKVGDALTAAATKLDDLLGRRVTDFDPIGDESARVIVRRLFDVVDPAESQRVSAAYHALYERVARESPGAVPPESANAVYAKRVVECYPFHPRLLDTAQGRLGALQEFNKSRGTLRLFARILRTVWESKQDLDLITAGDLDWSSPRIQADLLQRLRRDNFKSAVTSDIGKHAAGLDGGTRGIHVRAASALLLESIPMQSNGGLTPAELTLAVLRPEEAGPEPSEALDRLAAVCWHTYPTPGGRGWQFRYEPNIIKQIEERMGQVPVEDAKSRVLTEAQSYFGGPAFQVRAWPTSARQVPESAELQLALCEDEKIAKSVCANADDSNPKAPTPRLFQNAIVAVTASGVSFNAALDKAQRLLAAEAIERDHKSGDTARIARDQLQRVRPELLRQFRIQTYRAFDRVVLSGGVSYPLDEQFQVAEDQMLQRPQGQACLRKFLDSKNLLYQADAALDVGRFLKDVLPGAVPQADSPEVYTARSVHERFLGAPGLRLLPDAAVVRQTLLKAVSAGRMVVRLPDGRAFDNKGCVEGPEGSRRRVDGTLTTLPLEDSVLVARADSAAAERWLKADAPKSPGEAKKGGGVPPPPPPPAQVTATTWDKAIEYSQDRPLTRLDLRATTPAGAASLAALAQPLGADSLTLNVSLNGLMKDGGSVNFAALDVKPTHPTKPLAIAQTLFNAVEVSAHYEAVLSLRFGSAGRTGMESPLRALSESAPDAISPEAHFEKPSGAPQPHRGR